MKTEIGKIAESLRGGNSKVRRVRRNDDGYAQFHRYLEAGALTVKDQVGKFLGVSVGTPLQKKLSWLAIFLFIIAVIFAIICLAANNFEPRRDVILYAVGYVTLYRCLSRSIRKCRTDISSQYWTFYDSRKFSCCAYNHHGRGY